MNDLNIRTPRARRWGVRVSAVTGIAVVGVVATSGIALACHAIPNPDITKTSYSCNGDVHYQVDSWSQDTANANATNSKVRVEVAVNGGAFATVTESPVGPGTPIIGVWHSAVDVTSAVVRATPEVPWSGGDTTEEARSEPVALSDGPCVAVPAAKVTPVSCSTGSAGVILTNTGTRPATITVTGSAPASTTSVIVPAGGTSPVAVPVTEGSTSTVSALSGATVLTTASESRSCAVAGPAAVITFDCSAMSASLDNSASNVPVTFTVAGPAGSTSYVVAAGKTMRTPAQAVAAGQTAIMTVTSGGKVLDTERTTACTPVAVTPPVTVTPTDTAAVAPAAPATVTPVTAAPVTVAPVTAAPVTAAPVTAAPVTAAPVTVAPVKAAPVTVAPVTVADPNVSTATTAEVAPLASSISNSTTPSSAAKSAPAVITAVKAVTQTRTVSTAPKSTGSAIGSGVSVLAASITRSTPVVQPAGALAFTGSAHLGALLLSGLGLIAAGGAALLFGERKRA